MDRVMASGRDSNSRFAYIFYDNRTPKKWKSIYLIWCAGIYGEILYSIDTPNRTRTVWIIHIVNWKLPSVRWIIQHSAVLYIVSNGISFFIPNKVMNLWRVSYPFEINSVPWVGNFQNYYLSNHTVEKIPQTFHIRDV